MTDEATLEARVRQIEDRFAIQHLVAEYCRAIDSRDIDAFAACYTVDAVLRHEDGVMRIDGREPIRAYYEARFPTYGVTFHYPHAHSIVFDGPDDAHGTVTAHAEMALDGAGWIAALRYTDTYHREDGRWRFAERVLACWYYMKMSELPDGIATGLRKHYRGQFLPAELPESLATYRQQHGLP